MSRRSHRCVLEIPMIRIIDRDDAAGRRARPCRLVPGTILLAAVAIAGSLPCLAQTARDVSKAPTSKVESKTEKAERPVPPPDVVNAEKLAKQPPDPLEGPPYTTVKAWAIADGGTGKVLWGHREKEPLEPASTTKIMTALVVVRLLAKDPKVGDEMVTFSMKADRTIGSSSGIREGE